MSAATGRDDGTGAAQTFTTAYTGTDVIEYRTNRTPTPAQRTTGTAPNVTALDVASLYLINNADADRLVVTGPDYASQTYLSGMTGMTLSYGGRITAPQLLTGVGGTAHANTHGFTLDIVVANSTSATFNIATTTIGTSDFTIDGGAVNLGTGRLTIGGGTATLTESSEALAQASTFGFAGQIYGATADALGGTYWGLASDDAATFSADDGNPFGGAFIASRSGIAATITYPQNVFSLTAATGGNANAGDIDGDPVAPITSNSTYGVGIGTRTRTASAGNSLESDLIVITGGASADFGTATDADLAWLSAALETSVSAATGRDDGAGAAQTFTTAYTGTDVIEYRTNRTTGTAPNVTALDVASLYLINNADADRLVVTGPDYASQTYLSGMTGMTLSYGGRITAPQLLTGVGGTAHANTHGFTLDIVVANSTSATFNIATTTIGTSDFTIDGGAVNLGTGRLTIGGGTATLTESSEALAQASTFGFAGQIYGATADALGGTYWGLASDDAATFSADDGNPFGGAFIASRSGIAATITYPQNVFSLTAATGGNANAGDIDGDPVAPITSNSTYGVGIGTRTRTASAGNSLESDLIVPTTAIRSAARSSHRAAALRPPPQNVFSLTRRTSSA